MSDFYDLLLASKLSGGGGGGGGTDYLAEVLSNTITSYSNDTVAEISRGTFNSTPLESISMTALTKISTNNVFANCANITDVNFPSLLEIRASATFQTSGIKNFSCHTLGFYGSNTFQYCTKLEGVCTPNGYPRGAFYGCNKLKYVDTKGFSGSDDGSVKKVSQYTFYGCSILDKIIIRESNLMPLDNLNAFTNTPYDSGGAGGEIYVPSALISSYQTATNWTTLNGYGHTTWKAIEGSYYETHYADGTPISA